VLHVTVKETPQAAMIRAHSDMPRKKAMNKKEAVPIPCRRRAPLFCIVYLI
jgi:hypothetical protein